VNELLQDGNPIAAIAVVREEAGASLLEAKTYVDSLRREIH
jgi:ribosomal protein L7/L12